MQVEASILQRCWFLAGPTACGKSAVAMLLAERMNAEIIGLDSMSLYRGMDIGTAKPSPAARSRIPHHLIDVLQRDEEFTVADYLREADAACRAILERERTPLFVGGTGLYLRALLRGVFAAPAADTDYRRRLESRAITEERDWLHGRLQAVDPVTAARLHTHDQRRIVRALEVQHLTGRPVSEQQQERPLSVNQRPKHVYWFSPPRDWLYDRINRRVLEMVDEGWVDEVRSLLEADRPLSRTARQALGYQDLIAHIQGECSLAEAVERIQTRTRQFAKRQHTWFRNLEECSAIEISGTETPEALAERVFSLRE